MIDPNIAVLDIMAAQLGDLVDRLVFVGGATVGLYIDDRAVPKIRATIDIDCVVEVASRNEYYLLAEELRKLGFSEDPLEPVNCRYKKGPLILDVMPTKHDILDFTNRWYEEGIQRADKIALPSGKIISVFSLPYFLGAKLEAFKGRGKGDFMRSHDMEDIIAVIDGNTKFNVLCKSGSVLVQEYLQSTFAQYLKNDEFISALEGHISDRTNSSARAKVLVGRIEQLVAQLPTRA